MFDSVDSSFDSQLLIRVSFMYAAILVVFAGLIAACIFIAITHIIERNHQLPVRTQTLSLNIRDSKDHSHDDNRKNIHSLRDENNKDDKKKKENYAES
jgi:hypothetical protein